jgi:hypothetical protein
MLRKCPLLLLGHAIHLPLDRKGIINGQDVRLGLQPIRRPPAGKRYRIIDHNLDNEYRHNPGSHGHGHGALSAVGGHQKDHGHGDHGHGDHGHGDHGHGDHGHGDHGHGDHGHHEPYMPKQSKFSFNTLIPVAHVMLEDIPEKYLTAASGSTTTALATTKTHSQIAQVNIAEIEKSERNAKNPNFLAHKRPYNLFSLSDKDFQETEDWYAEYANSNKHIKGSNPNGHNYQESPFSRQPPHQGGAKKSVSS